MPSSAVERALYDELGELRGGTMLGEYSIQGVVAQSSMATVYAAVHAGTGEKAAIKVVSTTPSQDHAAVEAFSREGHDLNQMHHANIVEVLASGRLPDQRCYFAMEWLDGQSLKSRMQSGPLALDASCDILIQVCDALEAAHAQHIVHLDIKPDNVFLIPAGGRRARVKLLDFGIARHFKDQLLGAPAAARRAGLISGTPAYLSPEQAQGKEVNEKSDCYSFGVMAFEMLLGRLPFVADSLMQVFALHVQQPPPQPRLLWPQIPAPLERLLLGLLEKDPRCRPTLRSARSCLVGARGADQGRRVLRRRRFKAA